MEIKALELIHKLNIKLALNRHCEGEIIEELFYLTLLLITSAENMLSPGS